MIIVAVVVSGAIVIIIGVGVGIGVGSVCLRIHELLDITGISPKIVTAFRKRL